MKRRSIVSKRRLLLVLLAGAVLLALVLYTVQTTGLLPERYYSAADFGIETLQSPTDYNNNGTDDSTDLLQGARAYVRTRPTYKSAYYREGYPPDGEGVCTDVIWQAFRHAGYDLKAMVDADIAQNPEAYPAITLPDPPIDFRRVRNLRVFFDRHAQSLTTDPNDIAAWQPGDIAVFDGHIAVVSDRRNRHGQPWIIHNAGLPIYENNRMTAYTIVGHYRWSGKSEILADKD